MEMLYFVSNPWLRVDIYTRDLCPLSGIIVVSIYHTTLLFNTYLLFQQLIVNFHNLSYALTRGGFRGGRARRTPPPPLKFAKHRLYNVN